ncbi:MAG: hypothetical protein ACJ72E_03440 [Marmoricola sp.]
MRRYLRIAVPVAAAAAVLGWLPFLGRATASDEGGYMIVGSQWGHGSSLYGSYWVDRPPLLILLHGLAAALGGTVALRVIGILGVVVAVVLAGAISRAATLGLARPAHRIAVLAPVVIAATFLTTPDFGTMTVDGELLSVPLLLAGFLACIRACSATEDRTALRWAAAAGVAATSAAMVKQNAVDVFLLALVVLLTRALTGERARALRIGAVFLGAAVLTLTAFLLLSAARGTSPDGLWNALVTFRFDAARSIYDTSSAASSARLDRLLRSVSASLCPLLLLVLGLQVARARRTRHGGTGVPDLRWPALVVLAWEVVVIAGGGGFWLHYLIVLVPGMVLLAAAAAQRPLALRAVLGGALVAAVLSAGAATVGAAQAVQGPPSDALVVRYLKAHDQPGDTAVVAFGRPNILWDTHLRSPYDELWALPVLVRDHSLLDFTRVLDSPQAPTWVVVDGTSLSSEGVDGATAESVLDARYHPVAHEGRYVVWHHDSDRIHVRRSPERFRPGLLRVRTSPDGAPTPSPHAGAPFAALLFETRRS